MLFRKAQHFWTFWNKHPAFFFGLHLVLGSAAALSYSHWYIVVLFSLWLPFFFLKEKIYLYKILGAGLILASAFFYAHWQTPTASLEKECRGTAYLNLSTLKPYQSPFARSLLYKGIIECFYSQEGQIFYQLPCSIFMKIEKERPLANQDYLLEGTLIDKGGYQYVFKPVPNEAWKPVANTFSFAEWRYAAKQKTARYIKTKISDEKTAKFLSALVTGEIEERSLSFDFARLGLQHILAISGFHFALLAAFLGFLLRMLFPLKTSNLLLFLLLTSYFFFLGNAPSILRAWTAISLFLFAQIFHLRTTALNALGAGLIVEVIVDPLVVQHLGFQLSFLCTLAILFFYLPMEKFLQIPFPKRTLQDLIAFSKVDQMGYLLSSFFRKALALNLAVHLTTVLPLLCLFHKFPVLSLAYNLFFPLFVSLSLFLLLAAFLLSFLLPPLGELLHQCNSAFTSSLLEMTSHPPAFLDYYIRTPSVPFGAILLFLCTVIWLGVLWNSENQLETQQLR